MNHSIFCSRGDCGPSLLTDRGNKQAEAFQEFRAIMRRLDFPMESARDVVRFDEIEDELNRWGCRTFDAHEWINDQCGYWQHQLCMHCQTPKYPDLAKQSCGDLSAKMGLMTEDEYLNRTKK